jgi:hypothetical protein
MTEKANKKGTGDGSPFPKPGTENRPLFPQKSLENTTKKLSENTEYGILYHGIL